MHIFKSRNPIWLLLDIAIMIYCWKAGIIIGAIFFTFDTLLQLVYTLLPDMVDAWDKDKGYRVFYTLFFVIGVFFIIRYLVAENII